MGFIDYGELKTRVTIHDAIQKLGLELRQAGNQLRGFCPACLSGGDRALVVTPAKSLFYCWGCKGDKKINGCGDQLALVAHIRKIPLNEAANWLAGTVPLSRNNETKPVTTTVPPAPAAAKSSGFDPVAYAAKLDPAAAPLAPFGISEETLREWKAGYCLTGKLRGRLALPLCDRTGEILCYCGRALKDDPPQLLYGKDTLDPKSVLFGWERVQGGDVLYVTRDPLEVLKAYEGGVTAVSFLGDVTADSLQVLSLLMDERQVPSVEFI